MKTKNKWILVGVVVLFVSAGFTVRSMNSVKSMMYWAKVIKLQEAELRPINFVGRVIDQNGDPVVNAKAAVVISGNYFASGDAGNGMVATNSDGYFVINNLKGVSLGIYDFEKYGYQINTKTKIGNPPGETEAANPHFYDFKEHSNALLWSDYTREHPYVIKAWKVGKYAEVKTEKDRSLGFVPNGAVYTLDFTGTDTVRWEGTRDGDIRVSITRNDKEWKVVIEGIDGGVQEASDTYMNLAPESGYQKSLTFSGQAKEDFDHSNGIVTTKKIYFMSQHGKRYGSASLEMRPYFDEDTVIYTSYTINLEGGRELAVKPKE